MKKCSYCGKENDSEVSNCKECGTVLATESPVRVAEQLRQLRGKVAAELSGQKKPRNLFIVITVVAVAGIAAAGVFFSQSRSLQTQLDNATRELQQTQATARTKTSPGLLGRRHLVRRRLAIQRLDNHYGRFAPLSCRQGLV